MKERLRFGAPHHTQQTHSSASPKVSERLRTRLHRHPRPPKPEKKRTALVTEATAVSENDWDDDDTRPFHITAQWRTDSCA